MEATELYSIIVFYLIAILGIMGTIFYLVSPFKAMGRFVKNFGIDFQRINTNGEKDQTSLKKFFNYFGSLLLGANYLALFAIWMAFHDHNQLAWWSLTYYPIMFLWHFIITNKEDKSRYGQLVFLALTASALGITYYVGIP